MDTLINYVDKTVEEVEKAIASALPEKFLFFSFWNNLIMAIIFFSSEK